ncbi:MAG: PQQ-like beta-propeller repeat protein [Gemmataceae bacterium]|nr:PQQ-like beta-propeller repeat protein [Gemmataceae bacterium]
MTETTKARRRLRWWLLGMIPVLALGAVGYVWFGEGLEPGFRIPMTWMVILLAGVLLALWLALFSGFRWRTRLAGLAGPTLLAGLGVLSLRFEGCTGDMAPQLNWRWAPVRDQTLAAPEVSAAGPVNLRATSPHDFPRFLGSEGRAVVRGGVFSRDWSKQLPRLLWRQPIGAGWSAFATVGAFAVTQEQRGDYELVTCYEVTTGKCRWVHRDQVRFSEIQGGVGPRATPTIVDGQVCALGATGILHCLDGATGKPLWTRDTLAEAGMPNLGWGKSCSPLVFGDLVVVTLGDSTDRPLAAFKRNTGEPAWRAGRDKPSYASPVLTTLAGRRQIVVVNANSVSGHDPHDGRLLWAYDWLGGTPRCSQPVPVGDDRVYVSAGYGAGSVLLQVKPASGDELAVTELWKSPRMNTRFTNVAVRAEFVYGLDNGILACQELATGRLKWKGERYGHGQVLLVDDLLLAVGEWGEVALVEATPSSPRELGRFQALQGKTWNNPALSGPYLLLRNAEEAACYELP